MKGSEQRGFKLFSQGHTKICKTFYSFPVPNPKEHKQDPRK